MNIERIRDKTWRVTRGRASYFVQWNTQEGWLIISASKRRIRNTAPLGRIIIQGCLDESVTKQ